MQQLEQFYMETQEPQMQLVQEQYGKHIIYLQYMHKLQLLALEL